MLMLIGMGDLPRARATPASLRTAVAVYDSAAWALSRLAARQQNESAPQGEMPCGALISQ
jgi:hypothetical protein